jgi:hypothetical protein
MSLYKKVQFLMEDPQFYKMNRDDQGKVREMIYGFGGHTEEHLKDDNYLIDNCLSPHWSVEKQLHFINTKYERFSK